MYIIVWGTVKDINFSSLEVHILIRGYNSAVSNYVLIPEFFSLSSNLLSIENMV